MAVQDYSITPGANVSISGINIAEGCAAGNINGAIRQMMADVRVMFNGMPDSANFVTRTGGVFSGNPTFVGRGGYLHFNDSANISGRVFIQPIGGSPPAMQNGDWLLEY